MGWCISAPRSQLCDFPFWTDSGEGVRKGWGGWGSISVAPCALYSIAHMCTRYGGAVYHITGNVAFSRLVLTYDKPGWARWSGGQENSTDFLFDATNIARTVIFKRYRTKKKVLEKPKNRRKKYFWSKCSKVKNNLIPLDGIGWIYFGFSDTIFI